MTSIIDSFNKINSNIIKLDQKKNVKIIAVSKTFSIDHIKPLINFGHTHFGENKVQEAITKWSEVKKEKPNIKLHMVGKLQSNKAKNALDVFDYIHSLDNQKLADVLSKAQNSKNKFLKYFIQVNIGNESKKSGIPASQLDDFYNYCVNEKKLKIIGLMVIPPNDSNTAKYFKIINDLNSSLALKELSMGMSADYLDAVNHGATFVRIGSSIFGERS